MGNILDELTDVTAIECDDCGGAGFITYSKHNGLYNVENTIPCDYYGEKK